MDWTSEVITMLQMKRFKKPPKRIIMFDEEQQISGFVKTAADSCVALNAMVYAVPDAENYNKPKFFRPSEYEVQS